MLDQEYKAMETVCHEQGARDLWEHHSSTVEFLSRRTEPSQYPFVWNDSKDKWWKGPEFLHNVEEEWPHKDNAHSEKENAMKEIMKNPATVTHLISGEQVRQTGLHQIIDANRYSSLTKLLRITAYVLRFARRSKEKRGPDLNAEQMWYAEELRIKSIQNQSFPQEVCHLMLTRKTPALILVRQFDLYIDERYLAMQG